jgi:pimeloyl-ACP methyl ester carboxylesterase
MVSAHGQFGRGSTTIAMFYSHGVFEGPGPVLALKGRLEVDVEAAKTGAAARLHEVCRISFFAEPAPGYDADPYSAPTNREYAARLVDISQRYRDAGEITVHIAHSWAAAAAALAWTTPSYVCPDLAILEGSAFSDVIDPFAKFGGKLLGIPGMAYVARALYPLGPARALANCGVPYARAIAALLPDRYVPSSIAQSSFEAACRGVSLTSGPDLSRAGKHVAYVQGDRDNAIVGPRAIALVADLIRERGWSNVHLLAVRHGSHWPLITEPELLAKLLLELVST